VGPDFVLRAVTPPRRGVRAGGSYISKNAFEIFDPTPTSPTLDVSSGGALKKKPGWFGKQGVGGGSIGLGYSLLAACLGARVFPLSHPPSFPRFPGSPVTAGLFHIPHPFAPSSSSSAVGPTPPPNPAPNPIASSACPPLVRPFIWSITCRPTYLARMLYRRGTPFFFQFFRHKNQEFHILASLSTLGL